MKRSPRELEHELQRLKEGQGDGLDVDVRIEWRDADPEARPTGMAWDDEDGLLAYDFWGAQWDALDAMSDDVDIVALLGGYRAGKSVTGARWLLTQALEHPGTRHLAMGIDFSKAAGTTFRTLFEQLPGERTHIVTSSYSGPESSPIVADHNRSEHRLVLENDSVVILGAADVWNRYAGDEYAAVWLDEPSHYHDLHPILEMVGSRLTAPTGPKRMFWTLTGNGYNAAWEVLEKRQGPEGDPIGLDIEVVRASVRKNPYLDPSDVDRLERQFADTGREGQALEGGFAAATGLVYSSFSRDVHVVEPDVAEELAETGRRFYGYDSGWRDPRVLLEIGRSDYGQFVVVDEFYRGESHVENAIAWLRDNAKPVGPVFCEHEPADIEKFQRAGFPARRAEKSIDAGIDEVRHRLNPEDGDRPGLLVSARCGNLIQEFQGYKEEDVARSTAVDHALDALRYAIMGEAFADSYHARREAIEEEQASGVSYL